jgi:methionyl-tRNA formyltransferase
VAAEQYRLKVFQLPSLKGPAAEEALRGLTVDITVMAYVLQFVPQGLVHIPKHGTIQFHPSLLPKHRGPSSINWPIINGERQTGFTIFRPTDGLDEGPVILQRAIEIGPDDTLGTVYFDRLYPMGVTALLAAADLVVAGRHTETPQDETRASYEGWCRDPEARINWHAHLDSIHNLVRGCDPSPGAWTTIDGRKVRFYEARKHPIGRFAEVSGKPGEICAIGAAGFEVSVQGGRLEVLKVRTEGGDKMPAAAFAASAGLKVGSKLGGDPAAATQAKPAELVTA